MKMGVFLFDTETEIFIDFKKGFKNKNSISGNKIKSLFYEKKGILWVGTNGDGLNAFDLKNKIIYNYTTNDGLANNVIYSILPDTENNLWLSSNRGITMFSPPINFNNKPQITNYDNYDG